MTFGFVDDMYIEIKRCPRHSYLDSIQIQSSSRLGSNDMGVNPKRVGRMYKCIFDKASQNYKVSKKIEGFGT